MSDESTERGPSSRSAQKRAAHAVEELAQVLVELPEADWKRLPATGDLREQIRQARGIRTHGARKRQIKHLASLLRRSEEEQQSLRAFCEKTDGVHLQEQKTFHLLEQLRDRLCDTEGFQQALHEALGLWPSLDPQLLTRLARSVQATGDRGAFREIFKRLREAAEGGK